MLVPPLPAPVRSVRCAESVVDVDITKFGQRRAESLHLILVGLHLKQRCDSEQPGAPSTHIFWASSHPATKGRLNDEQVLVVLGHGLQVLFLLTHSLIGP